MKNFLSVLVFLVLLVSACVQEVTTVKTVEDVCIEICNSAKQDLTDGPCLGNPIPEFSDWVCDVAHSPRQDLDNLPENQCSVYRSGQAHHFVEVDPDCNLIRSV